MRRLLIRLLCGWLVSLSSAVADDIPAAVSDSIVVPSPQIVVEMRFLLIDVVQLRKQPGEVGTNGELVRLRDALRLPKIEGEDVDVAKRLAITPLDDADAIERVVEHWRDQFHAVTALAQPKIMTTIGKSGWFHQGDFYEAYVAEGPKGVAKRAIPLGTTVHFTPLFVGADRAVCDFFGQYKVADWENGINVNRQRLPYIDIQMNFYDKAELLFDRTYVLHGRRHSVVIKNRLREKDALIFMKVSRVDEMIDDK